MNYKLNDVVRHELEHITQVGKNKIAGRVKPSTSRQRELSQKDYRYFLLRDEIPAMVAGMYRQAKTQKKELDIVFSNYLDYFIEIGQMTEEQKTLVMDTWIDYVKKNYPAAKFSTEL